MSMKNPVPLAGGHRAGSRYVVQQSSTRDLLKKQAQQRLHRQHLARRIHHLGARIFFELLDELDRHHGIGDDLDRRLARYAGLDSDMLRVVGAEGFAPHPMRVVRSAS